MSSISIILCKDQSIEKDKVGVDNNKTGDSTIINFFDDNEEEVEESSIISGHRYLFIDCSFTMYSTSVLVYPL